MTDRACIVSRTLEDKIAIAENNNQNTLLVTLDVLKEILSMLKEQEAKPVKVVKNAYNHEFYYCPRCDRSFYELYYGKPKFCDKCGQELKWYE